MSGYLLALAGATTLAVATFAPSAAAPTGITPQMKSQIDALARGVLAHQHIAGFSLAIARDGRVLYARGYGYRDLARHLPADEHTIYNIASMTKQFTAASVMLLQEDGKLNINDTLSKYLPAFPHAKQMTLRQVLTHTSGIPDYTDVLTPADLAQLSTARIFGLVHGKPLAFRPGSMYQYSNTNYIVAGAVVEKVSGIPFDDFLSQRIFQPLGMHATSIGDAPQDKPTGARGYTVSRGRTVAAEPQTSVQLDYPDGGVNTNVLDLVKWDAALDARRVVPQVPLAMMFTPAWHGRETTYGYGLGLGVNRLFGHREILHQGEWTGYAGENATFPDDRFVVITLSNTDGFNEDLLTEEIFAMFYPPTPAQRAAHLQSAIGEDPKITAQAKGWLRDQQDKRYGTLQRVMFVGRESSGEAGGIIDYYWLYYPGAVVQLAVTRDQNGNAGSFTLTRAD